MTQHSPPLALTRNALIECIPQTWADERQSEMYWLFGASQAMLDKRVSAFAQDAQGNALQLALYREHAPLPDELQEMRQRAGLALAWFEHVTRTLGRKFTYLDSTMLGVFNSHDLGASGERATNEANDRMVVKLLGKLPVEVRTSAGLQPLLQWSSADTAAYREARAPKPPAPPPTFLDARTGELPLFPFLRKVSAYAGAGGLLIVAAAEAWSLLSGPGSENAQRFLYEAGENAVMACVCLFMASGILSPPWFHKDEPAPPKVPDNVNLIELSAEGIYNLQAVATDSPYATAWLEYVERLGRGLRQGDLTVTAWLIQLENEELLARPHY